MAFVPESLQECVYQNFVFARLCGMFPMSFSPKRLAQNTFKVWPKSRISYYMIFYIVSMTLIAIHAEQFVCANSFIPYTNLICTLEKHLLFDIALLNNLCAYAVTSYLSKACVKFYNRLYMLEAKLSTLGCLLPYRTLRYINQIFLIVQFLVFIGMCIIYFNELPQALSLILIYMALALYANYASFVCSLIFWVISFYYKFLNDKLLSIISESRTFTKTQMDLVHFYCGLHQEVYDTILLFLKTFTPIIYLICFGHVSFVFSFTLIFYLLEAWFISVAIAGFILYYTSQLMVFTAEFQALQQEAGRIVPVLFKIQQSIGDSGDHVRYKSMLHSYNLRFRHNEVVCIPLGFFTVHVSSFYNVAEYLSSFFVLFVGQTEEDRQQMGKNN